MNKVGDVMIGPDDKTEEVVGSTNGRQQQQQHRWHWKWNSYYRSRNLKDRFDVQQAQSRFLHVVSLAQLETIILDDDGLLLEFVDLFHHTSHRETG